jgi:hypothetical protein
MKKAILTNINENIKVCSNIFVKNFTPMKSVFKQNKELTFLKEEFKAFVKKKNEKNTPEKEQISDTVEETLVLEDTV